MSSKLVHVNFPASGGSRSKRSTPQQQVDADMAEMFGMSMDVIKDEMELGNPRVAMWFAEVYLKKYGSRITGVIEIKLDTARDIEEASKEVVMASAEGRISFEDAKNVQEALARHAVLSGIRTVDEMRQTIEAMEVKSKTQKNGLNGHTPSWGRLGGKDPHAKGEVL